MMDYNGATLWAATGHTLMLPNFTGYFKWDWGAKKMIFINGDFRCNAEDLNVKDRTDWYYII